MDQCLGTIWMWSHMSNIDAFKAREYISHGSDPYIGAYFYHLQLCTQINPLELAGAPNVNSDQSDMGKWIDSCLMLLGQDQSNNITLVRVKFGP